VERGEPDDPLTGAWEAERRSGDGGEGGGSQNSDAGRARGSESGKWGGGQGWEERLGARGQHCHRKRGFVLIIVIIFTSNNTPTIKGLKSDHITFYLKRYKTL
jgi:hypothetical protein